MKFKAGSNDKEYKIEKILNNIVYAKESETNHLLDLYYLVFQKDYPNKENI